MFNEKRPQIPEFESMLYPHYIIWYNLVNQKPRKKNPPVDMKGRYVVKRKQSIIPRYRFLTAADKEEFYYKQLLLKVPFRSDKDLVSEDNESKTYQEECYIRELFIQEDELDVSFKEMKSRNFDPMQILKIAKKMLHEKLSDSKTIARKKRDLEYSEEIPFGENELALYQSVALGERQIQRFLIVNRERILQDKKYLGSKVCQLTASQKTVFD